MKLTLFGFADTLAAMFTTRIRIMMMAPALALGLAATVQAEEADAARLNVPPEGFTALFNGKDLSGWFGHGTGDPRKLWAMSKGDLVAHQKRRRRDK